MNPLRLIVTTPLAVAVDAADVASLRAEDASGDFGILPGHADFLTAIDAGVLRWRAAAGPWRYCALRGAVLTVFGGVEVRVACREAILGDDLARLLAAVRTHRAEALDAQRRARVQSTRLHARAIRQLAARLAMAGDPIGLTEDTLP